MHMPAAHHTPQYPSFPLRGHMLKLEQYSSIHHKASIRKIIREEGVKYNNPAKTGVLKGSHWNTPPPTQSTLARHITSQVHANEEQYSRRPWNDSNSCFSHPFPNDKVYKCSQLRGSSVEHNHINPFFILFVRVEERGVWEGVSPIELKCQNQSSRTTYSQSQGRNILLETKRPVLNKDATIKQKY